MIQEIAWKFKSPLVYRSCTAKIVLHHSASGFEIDAYDIHRWHQEKGWTGIGYHYVVLYDGTIQRGRPENRKGSHAYQDDQHEANTDGIGICVVGNFEETVPKQAQINSLAWLIGDIQSRYRKSLQVMGHRDVQPTACPGGNFPMENINALVANPIPSSSSPARTPCVIDIRGTSFAGYLLEGRSYFDGAAVTDVIEALNAKTTFDESTKTVKVR